VTHWFLSFLCKRRDDERWQPQDATTRGEHPLDYITRARAAYTDYEYRMQFFHVIPEDVFKRVHPEIDDEPPPVGAIPRQIVR
jgi:hypothetical protein